MQLFISAGSEKSENTSGFYFFFRIVDDLFLRRPKKVKTPSKIIFSEVIIYFRRPWPKRKKRLCPALYSCEKRHRWRDVLGNLSIESWMKTWRHISSPHWQKDGFRAMINWIHFAHFSEKGGPLVGLGWWESSRTYVRSTFEFVRFCDDKITIFGFS